MKQRTTQKEATEVGSDGDFTPDATLNMTTILCPEVQSFPASPIAAANGDSESVVNEIPKDVPPPVLYSTPVSDPSQILFWLPPNALGQEKTSEGDILQVTCRVTDAQMKVVDFASLMTDP